MPAFRTGTVDAVISERAGLQRVTVDGERAYVLTDLIGPVAVGDRVVFNTTAVDLGLGTGGWHVVHWNLSRHEWSQPGPGHVLKLRYTSLQADTGVAEEVEGFEAPESLNGMPVVACALHSQVACVAAVFKHLAPDRRLVYVMTDGGALPLALSDLVADLCDAGLLDGTVTAGQAFGGQFEAVNVPSALDVAAAAAAADAVVVGTGPGVVGTATAHGFSGLEVAAIIDAAGAAGGRPVVALRFSDADPRARHQGVSHHSVTALGQANRSAIVALPADEPDLDVGPLHTVERVETPDVPALLHGAGLRVTTMGRGPDDDPRFYAYAGAAGAVASRLVP
ncbi:MAG: hypothetical protein QOK43_1602 [Acidimicrobiaceae bacterium]|nr:hypothetical protein [Acidimicrobiaceae bacterium]